MTLGLTLFSCSLLQNWESTTGIVAALIRSLGAGESAITLIAFAIPGVLISLPLGSFESLGSWWGLLPILASISIAVVWLRLTGSRWRYILVFPLTIVFLVVLMTIIIILPVVLH
jgi:hypothetical protein